MHPGEEHLARFSDTAGNWAARAELAHLKRRWAVSYKDSELLAGATGAPGNRAELQRLLDAIAGPPRSPCWRKTLTEYVRWEAKCPLGLVSLAHVVEASGNKEKALALYERAIAIDPSVAAPPLACLCEKKNGDGIEETPEEKMLRQSKSTAVLVAVIAHLFIIIAFSFWAVSSAPRKAPQLVATSPPDDSSDSAQAPPEKKTFSPITATANLNVVSSSAPSELMIAPSAPAVLASASVLGGTSFSPSMNFGGGSGGNVSFFGSQGKTKNLVYVVDVSGSMSTQGENGKSRFDLMKEELARSVSALPISVKFRIILFSDSARYIEQSREESGMLKADDPESFPKRLLVRATRSQVRKTLKEIEGISLGGGTNWRLPLKMAINLQPDLIYFMTDGEFTSDNGKVPVIDDVVDYNRKRSRARINTICLMELKAYDELQELARRTRGTVFLVKENGEVLRGMQIDQIK
ncbi:VWA domain-containing protein [Verrucomicrobiales bacterium]|jgi:hypothetical protein|nr:VWA domain-containing protein [Verrucomicrobiales bacterium]